MTIQLKKLCVFTCAVLGILLVLCSCNYDPYDGKRPFDYGDGKWICEIPDIWFEINTNDTDYYDPEGELNLAGETVKIKLFFVAEVDLVFIKVLDNQSELKGNCEFYPDRLVVEIDQENDDIFHGKYDELIFRKVSAHP